MNTVANYKLNILEIEHLLLGFYLKSLRVISGSSKWYIFLQLNISFILIYKDIPRYYPHNIVGNMESVSPILTNGSLILML